MTKVVNGFPSNPIYSPGKYVLVLDGEVIWESDRLISLNPAKAAQIACGDILKKFPNAQLYTKVNL